MLAIIPLITAFIQAATEYLKLKNKSYYYDLADRSQTKIDTLKNKIEELRAKGDNDSQSIADDLLQQLVAEKAQHKYFSTLSSPTL